MFDLVKKRNAGTVNARAAQEDSSVVALPQTARRTLLDGAVPPIAQAGSSAVGGPYGLVLDGLPLPETGGSYVVDFQGAFVYGACMVRVLAYIDPYGRAFAADAPIEVPPAREPSLSFAQFTEQPSPGVQLGCVYVHDGHGSRTDVARYRCENDRYALFDTWFGFGSYGAGLDYEEVFARAYLAFVYRPSLGAAPVPARGLSSVNRLLDELPALRALRSVVELVRSADADPTFRVPALVRCLAKWLGEAGLSELDEQGIPDSDLRLVRTVRYADIFFIGREAQDSRVSDRQIWALEAALNRFKLIGDALGEDASAATDADCARWDAYIIQTVGMQQPVIDQLDDAPGGASGGEWMLRCGISSAVEHARLPFRVTVDTRADVAEGLVALEVVSPDASFMPEWVWADDAARAVSSSAGNAGSAGGAGEGSRGFGQLSTNGANLGAEAPGERGGWTWVGDAARASQARHYAMHAGLLFAAAAFEACDGVDRVLVRAVPFRDESQPSDAAEASGKAEAVGEAASAFELPGTEEPFYCVLLTRQDYCETRGFATERATDPSALFTRCACDGSRVEVPVGGLARTRVDARTDAVPAVSAATSTATAPAALEASAASVPIARASSVFDAVRALPSAAFRKRAPELHEGSLSEQAGCVLGSTNIVDLRIQYDSDLRLGGETLADRIVRAPSTSAAIAIVREAESQAKEDGAFERQAACHRFMAGLVDGSVDMSDQNAVVSLFIGEDRCRIALGKARAIAQDNPQEAVSILADAVAEAAALDGFTDGAATVYRTFDSYASRILYNLARRDQLDWCPQACADADKAVKMTSDAFYLCHLDLVSLLEDSFERADDALRYGRRACQMAPTTMVGFRTLARAYMLTGDMESSAATLEQGLRIALQPSDIAVAYYQLAYVLWRLGKPRVGAACYVKSLQAAPAVQVQATTELKELLDETGIAMPERDSIDAELMREGVPVAPTEAVLDALGSGAAAAVDEGLFPVARNLLALRLRYRPDDALTGVLGSLED